MTAVRAARPSGARCVCCGGGDARPAEDLGELLCARCGGAWKASAERARAATARADFIDRQHREIGAAR
jgi:hypothetical protein